MKGVAIVTAVYTVTDVSSRHLGQQLVNVDRGGGPDGIVGVVNAHQGAYFPQVGDKVVVERLGDDGGDTEWIVTDWLTPNRGLVVTVPEVPNWEVVNSAPPGWTQASTIWTEPGATSMFDFKVVPTAPVTLPPPSTAGTFTQLASVSRTYRYDFGGTWATDTLRPHQGTYYGFGPWEGIWLYPSMTAALSGKTITRFRIFLHRAPGSGDYGPVQTHLYLHNYGSLPGGAPSFLAGPVDKAEAALSSNGSADVDLPLSWAAAIQAGTAAGIGISANDQASYSILYGTDEDPSSGLLTFDYA